MYEQGKYDKNKYQMAHINKVTIDTNINIIFVSTDHGNMESHGK